MLAISAALMAAPDLILLDEPSLGLSRSSRAEIFEIVVRINRERGTTILVVEQNANMALNAADYGYVLENGRIVMEDAAPCCEKDDMKEFYLGMKEESARRGAGRKEEEDDDGAPGLWDPVPTSNVRTSKPGPDPARFVVTGDTVPAMFWNVACRAWRHGLDAPEGPGHLARWSWNQTGERARDRRWPDEPGASAGRHRVHPCPTRWSNGCWPTWRCCRAAGGVSNGIYPTDAHRRCSTCAKTRAPVVLFVEDDEQLDKALVREQLPEAAKIVVFDMEGLRDLNDPA